jgi:hypothetical protein
MDIFEDIFDPLPSSFGQQEAGVYWMITIQTFQGGAPMSMETIVIDKHVALWVMETKRDVPKHEFHLVCAVPMTKEIYDKVRPHFE